MDWIVEPTDMLGSLVVFESECQGHAICACQGGLKFCTQGATLKG